MKKLKVLGILVLCISALVVFIGWALDIHAFKSVIPGLVTMKLNTAISFLLTSFIHASILDYRNIAMRDYFQIMIITSNLILLLLTLLVLTSLYFNINTGIENLIIPETPQEAVLSTAPGRPSIGTLVAFALTSVYGYIFLSYIRKRNTICKVIGSIIILIGGVAVIGYSIGQPLLYYSIEDKSTAMAIHTAVLFMINGAIIYFSSQQTTYEHHT